MKIASWNVNSIKVRFDQVCEWLNTSQCDILALQELKLDNAANLKLIDEFKLRGYNYYYNGQKTYNGVAILSKYPLTNISLDIPGYNDEQKRVISASYNDLRIVCAYFVNGESLESSKFQYKLEWLAALYNYLQAEILKYPKLILLGDFNIAPANQDCYDPALWHEQVLCSSQERQAFNKLLGLGLYDSFRVFNQHDKQYTWWDYRNLAFRLKKGLRIDHILATGEVLKSATSCSIDIGPRKLERPSDHAPIILELN